MRLTGSAFRRRYLRQDGMKRGVREAYAAYPGYRARRRRSSHPAFIASHATSADAAAATQTLPDGIADPTANAITPL